MRTLLRALPYSIIIIALSSAGSVASEWPESEKDFRKLPTYCRVKLQKEHKTPSNNTLWRQRLGSSFGHLHHYCKSMHAYQHAMGMYPKNGSEQRKQAYFFRLAINGINYMEGHVDVKTHRIFAEMYTMKANILLTQGKIGEALQYFELALKVNDKYTKAYTSLSKFHLSINDKESALAVLDRGLKNIPKSKSLARRRKELLAK